MALQGSHCANGLIVQQKIVKHYIEFSVLRLQKIWVECKDMMSVFVAECCQQCIMY